MIELLIFGFIILSTVCLWILIENRKQPKFLFWFIPILLILVTSTYITYTSILGFPRVSKPPEGGIYISHFVDEPYWIFLWVLEKKAPRSYQIVYSRKIHDALEGVKGEALKGSYMVLKEGPPATLDGEEQGDGNDSGGGFTVGGDISFYKWDFQDHMPQKD